MSDPMTNAEVEDVLSSIRRLVSDDKAAEPEPEQPATPDRLVLTPSLRVQDEEAGAPEDTDVAAYEDAEAPPDDDAPEDAAGHFGDAETVHDAPEYAADDSGDAFDFQPQSLSAFIEEQNGYQAETDTTDVDAPETDAVAASSVGPETFLSYVRRGEPFQMNAPLSDAPAEDAGVEPEWDGDSVAEDHVPDVSEQHEEPADQSTPDVDHTAEEVAPAATDRTLSDKIAALETLVADRADEWEPDDPGADAYAGTEAPTMAWEDADALATPTFSHFAHAQRKAPEADIPAEPPLASDEPFDTVQDDVYRLDAADVASEMADDAAAVDDDETHGLTTEHDVLDEEALRDLVATIVREELQGALGERITRNVRKLVRREIHRALAAQDLE